jgi:hypothetical protein
MIYLAQGILYRRSYRVVMQSFCPPGSGSSVRKVTVYVSDFGKKRMELESRHGPQGIWKENLQDDGDDENADLYDQIADVDGDSEEDASESEDGGDNSDDGAGSSEGSEAESEQSSARGRGKKGPVVSRKALKGADFVRKNGAVGLVLHDDMKTRGLRSRYRSDSAGSESESDASGSDDSQDEEDEEDDDSQTGNEKAKRVKKPKDGDGFDEVALRKYELSKLR